MEPLSHIEQLLETLGADEAPGDTKHRYALRRALLCSHVFGANRTYIRWFQIFTVTGYALAGGLVVAVVVSSSSALNTGHSGIVTASAAVPTLEQDADIIPAVEFMDFSELVSKERVDTWIQAPLEFVAAR